MDSSIDYRIIGSVDESGLINSLDRDGITDDMAILELIGNVPDAYNVGDVMHLSISSTPNSCIEFKDYGKGFTFESACNAFSLYKSTHASDKSIGVSNYGLKAATKKLSRDGKTTIETKSVNHVSLIIEIDWAHIMKVGKYTGNVRVKEMTTKENVSFMERLNGHTTGTIIRFKYCDTLHNAIETHFNQKGRWNKVPLNRIDFAFGKIKNFTITFNKIATPMYDPFNLNCEEFIFGCEGRTQHKISLYEKRSNDKSVYLFAELLESGKYIYYAVHPNGSTAFKPTEGDLPKGYVEIDTFIQNMSCMTPYDTYYNAAYPMQPTSTGQSCVSTYEQDFWGSEKDKNKKGDNNKNKNDEKGIKTLEHRDNVMMLVRNGARIGIINIGNKTLACGGNSQYEKFLKLHIQHEILYNPYSSQVNKADNLIGVQKNKHLFQQETKNIKGLMRLCEYNRNRFGDFLWKKMTPDPTKARPVIDTLYEQCKIEPVATPSHTVLAKTAKLTVTVTIPPTVASETVTVTIPPTVVSDTALVTIPPTVVSETVTVTISPTVASETVTVTIPPTVASDTVLVTLPANPTVASDTVTELHTNAPPPIKPYENKICVDNYDNVTPMTAKDGLLFIKSVFEKYTINEINDMIRLTHKEEPFSGLGRATIVFKTILHL